LLVVAPLLLWVVMLCSACRGAESEPDDLVCPRAAAAFDVKLTAAGGELPMDTQLEVTVEGATVESFSLHEGNQSHQVVCCVAGESAGLSLSPATCAEPLPQITVVDASLVEDRDQVPFGTGGAEAGARGVDTIHCRIWSNGAAHVLVHASGYPEVVETLVAQEDDRFPDCAAWRTVQIALRLQHADAAVFDER
jgi:hypothetical protein